MKPRFKIPEPCHENWKDMSPTERGRFCDSCAKEVKDFSRSTDAEIVETLQAAEGKVCGRFRSSQVEVPEAKLIDLLAKRTGDITKVAAASLLFFSCDSGLAQGQIITQTMGDVEIPDDSSYIMEYGLRINGVVRSENGEALAYANVHYEHPELGSQGVVTDMNGLFELHVPSHKRGDSELSVQVDYVGYSSKTIHIPLQHSEVISIEVVLDDMQYFTMGLVIEPPTEKVQSPPSELPVKGEDVYLEGNVEVITGGIPEPCRKPEIEALELMGDTIIIDQIEIVSTDSLESEPINEEIDMQGESTETPSTHPDSALLEVPKVMVYPNPSEHYIQVTSKASLVPAFEIYDITGKLVLSGSLGHKDERIDISTLGAGTYLFIGTEAHGQRLSSSFVVQRN